jgi:glycosyltransferase involved in cell wall biosynthesis
VPEVVEHGLLVEPGSAQALADGLRKMCRDALLRRRLAEAGAGAVFRYNTPEVSRQFLTAVRHLV